MAATQQSLALKGIHHALGLGDLSLSNKNTTTSDPSSSSPTFSTEQQQHPMHPSSPSRRISLSASKRLSVNTDLANAAGIPGESSDLHSNIAAAGVAPVPMEKRKSGGGSGSRKNRESGLPSPPLTGESMEHLPTKNQEEEEGGAYVYDSNDSPADADNDGIGTGVGLAITSGYDDSTTSLKPSAADQASSTVFDHPLADLDDGRAGTIATSAGGDDDRTHVGGIDDGGPGMDVTDVEAHRPTTAATSTSDDGEIYPLGHPRFSIIKTMKRQQQSSSAAAAGSSANASPYPWERYEHDDDVIPHDHEAGYHTTIRTQESEHGKRKSRPAIPHSSYYFGPPPANSAYGTAPQGRLGVHHPREIIRIERDYTGGELPQFSPTYLLELEGRVTPTQFLESVNTINEILISAYSVRWAMVDNLVAVLSLQLSRLVLDTHYDKEMQRLRKAFDELNNRVFNPAGVNLLWPRNVAFLFLEVEYYVGVTRLLYYYPLGPLFRAIAGVFGLQRVSF